MKPFTHTLFETCLTCFRRRRIPSAAIALLLLLAVGVCLTRPQSARTLPAAKPASADKSAPQAGALLSSDFETGSFAGEGWTAVNGTQINKWEVGTAVNNGGTRSAYISNDGGATNNYSGVANVSHFYRDITFPAGETRIILSFDWRGEGINNLCDLRVFLVPTTTTPAAGTQLASGQIGTTLRGQTNFTNATITLAPANAGTTQRLVFSWRNNTATTATPGFAVDNVHLVTQTPVSFSGTVNVGAGEVYPSLTNSGGLFHAINESNLSGNLTVNITGDLLNETGLHALNQPVETGAGAYTITIRPSGAARLISGIGPSFGALIRLNGADRVTVDGELTPGSRGLTVRNNNTSAHAVIGLLNNGASGAQNNVLKYLTLESGGALTAENVIRLTGADNDNNRVEGCKLSRARTGIFSEGASAANPNQGNVFTGNLLNTPEPFHISEAGIHLGYENNAQVTQNIIGTIKTTGNAYGIDAGHGSSKPVTNITIARNLISDIVGGQNGTQRALGIGLLTGAPGTSQLSNNAVSMQPTRSNFYSTAVFVSAATGSTTQIHFNSISLNGNINHPSPPDFYALTIAGDDPVVQLRNNVLAVTNTINNNNISQAALALLYTTGNTFNNLTSDHNDFFLSPGVERYVVLNTDFFNFSFGFQTLANWQTASGEDAHSLTTDPLFNEANSNLRPLTGSPLLGAGMNGTGVTTDLTGAARGNPPSIGAYETTGETTPPVIAYTPFPNSGFTATRTVGGVVITDQTGVNTAPGTKPRLYYKRSADANTFIDNTNATGGWKFVEADNAASPFAFTIDYAKLNGGVGAGLTIQYFIVAQDTAAPPNVGINAGQFEQPPAGVNLAGAQFPIGQPINSYQVVTPIPAAVNVGAGQTFTSLTNDGGLFEAVNNRVLTGNVTVSITSDLSGETGTHALNQWAEEGAGNYTLTIKPGGAPRIVSGNRDFDVLFRLNGADRVTIDGALTPGSRDLTFRATSSATRVLFWLQSAGTNGAQNNTFKNLNLEGFRSGNDETIIAIGSGNSTTGTSINDGGTDNDNNRIEGCRISTARYGIYLIGQNAANKNIGTVITDNLLNATTPNQLELGGIFAAYEDGIRITRNRIAVSATNGSTGFGISLGVTDWTATSFVGGAVSNATVERNFIEQVTSHTVGAGIVAYLHEGQNRVINNSIAGVLTQAILGSLYGSGISLFAGAGTSQIAFNSVAMTGTAANSTSRHYALAIHEAVANPVVEARDNVFYNTQTTGGPMHYAVGLRNTGGSNLTLNNNAYFVAGDAVHQFGRTGGLSTTGTDRATLSDWQTATSKDLNSIFVNPQFNNPANDLQPVTGSPLLGAGVSLAGITTDILGVTRGNPPSLGAFESAANTSGPTIVYAPLTNASAGADRALSNVVITDFDGVNGAPGTRPRVYYKRGTDANTFNDNTGATGGWKFVEASGAASPFAFTLDYSKLSGGGGVSVGQTIQYFVVAQDLAPLPLVAVNNGVFAAPPTSVNLTAAAFPVTGGINSYQIVQAYAGTLNVGTGETIPSLTRDGGLFQSLNNGVLTGDLTVNITSDLTFETGTHPLRQWLEEGAGNYRLTIRPSGGVRTIPQLPSSLPLIRLLGADRVTVDGTGATPESRDLILLGASDHRVISVESDGPNGAQQNTFRNLDVRGHGFTLAGIGFGSGFAEGFNSFGTANNDNRVENCLIGKAQYGIFALGLSAAAKNTGNVFTRNRLDQSTPNNLKYGGVFVGFQDGVQITENLIDGINTNDQVDVFGIAAGLAGFSNGINQTGAEVTNALIARNRIGAVVNTAAFSAVGIYLAAAASGVNRIFNNMIHGVAGNGTLTGFTAGIQLGGGAATTQVYHNSVWMRGTQTGGSESSYALALHGNDPPADLRNNILVNTQTTGTGTSYAVGLASTTFANLTANNNDLFVGAGAQFAVGKTGGIAQNAGTNHATPAAWQTATGKDADSVFADPRFVSATDLHIAATGDCSPVANLGAPLAAVTTDFDNEARHAQFPDIGADEFNLNCTQPAAVLSRLILNAADLMTLGGNTTVNQLVVLGADLTTGANRLILPNTAACGAGTGDVVGHTQRNGPFALNTPYCFGHTDNRISFASGTPPNDILVQLVKGPTSFPGDAVPRTYNITPTGGSGYQAGLRLRYSQNEVGAINENALRLWRFDGAMFQQHPTADTIRDTANNWVEAVNLTNFSPWVIAPTSAVCPDITVNPATLPNGIMGQPYNQTLTASGRIAPYAFAVTAGTLPTGLTLSPTGALSGTPTVAGTFNFTVTATDAEACTGNRAYTLTLINCPTITINPTTSPNGFVGHAYSQMFNAIGGAAPYTFAVSAGALPNGLNLATTGLLSGTPSTPGTFNFTVRATDADSCTGQRQYTVIISGSGLQFYPLPAPVRLLDTRGNGVSPNACTVNNNQPIAGDTALLQPARGICGIPANARAITGNITTVQSGGGFLTLYPSDAIRPTVAATNYAANEVVNNVFTVGLGAADGAFKIYAHSTTEVVVDVSGYYAPPAPGGLYFHALPNPVRLLETRAGQPVGCILPGAPLQAGVDNTYQATGGNCTGIPVEALALVGNATTVSPQGPGFLTLFPADAQRPLVAASNYAANQIVNGPFTVGLSANGQFKVYSHQSTELVIDLLGYFSTQALDANGPGLLFTPLAHPVRLLETRAGQPVGCFKPQAPLNAQQVYTQPARGLCDGLTIPTEALGVVGNATTVLPTGGGFLTVWPSNAPSQPTIATSNFDAGSVVNRHFLTGLGADGAFKLFSLVTTELVIDLSGYFAP